VFVFFSSSLGRYSIALSSDVNKFYVFSSFLPCYWVCVPAPHNILHYATQQCRSGGPEGGPGPKYVTYFFLFSPRPPLGRGEPKKLFHRVPNPFSAGLSRKCSRRHWEREQKMLIDLRLWPNRDTTPEFASRDWGKPLKIGRHGRHSRKNSYPTPPSLNSSLWVAYCYTTPLSRCVMSFSGPLVKLHVVYTLPPLSETEGAEFFTVCSTQDQNMYILINLIRRLLPTKYYIFFKNDHRPMSLQTLFPYNVPKYILEL